MKRSLMAVSVISLLLWAGTAQGAVNKGEIEIEVLGGWVMEKAETPDIAGVEPPDVSKVFTSEGTGEDLDGWFAMGGIGFFTSKNFQIGPAGFYTNLEGDTNTLIGDTADPVGVTEYEVDVEAAIYGIGARAKWHFFPGKQWVPYIGGQAFWASADVDVSGAVTVSVDGEPILEGQISDSDSVDGILWGPIVGVRCELGSHAELLLEYQYHMWAGDLDDMLDNGHGFFAGLAFRVK